MARSRASLAMAELADRPTAIKAKDHLSRSTRKGIHEQRGDPQEKANEPILEMKTYLCLVE